jgi:hypothetical protein
LLRNSFVSGSASLDLREAVFISDGVPRPVRQTAKQGTKILLTETDGGRSFLSLGSNLGMEAGGIDISPAYASRCRTFLNSAEQVVQQKSPR